MTTTDNTTTPALADMDLDKLEELARAATPQNFDSAQVLNQGHIECPSCDGSGEVELTADYCNYDGRALGVQFYGIGPEHRAAEAFYRAANPAAVLQLIALARRAAKSVAPDDTELRTYRQALEIIGVRDCSDPVAIAAAALVETGFWTTAPSPQVAEGAELPPVEHDTGMDRWYVPLPGGWEVQTKGKGSSFRIAHAPSDRRWIVMDEHLHDPLVAMANATRDAIAASRRAVGGEPIYQVQFLAESGAGSSAWHDASEDAYQTFMPARRRIVYATPAPASAGQAGQVADQLDSLLTIFELDVEAERRAPVTDPVKSIITGVREFYLGLLSSHLPPEAFDQARADDITQVAYQGVADRFLALVKSVAAQSTAQVSTERAGDATFEYRADAEDIWHKAPLAELEQIASDGFQVRAPSPNNSPVGGKD